MLTIETMIRKMRNIIRANPVFIAKAPWYMRSKVLQACRFWSYPHSSASHWRFRPYSSWEFTVILSHLGKSNSAPPTLKWNASSIDTRIPIFLIILLVHFLICTDTKLKAGLALLFNLTHKRIILLGSLVSFCILHLFVLCTLGPRMVPSRLY